MCNQLWVQNSASKLSFKQSAQSNGADATEAVHNGKNGGDGLSGTSGTEVIIQARDLYTEGPFVVQVQGGKGGNGGKGSDGKPGEKGADGTENPLWESEGWPEIKEEAWHSSETWHVASDPFRLGGAIFTLGLSEAAIAIHCIKKWCSSHGFDSNRGDKGEDGGNGGNGGRGGNGGASVFPTIVVTNLHGDIMYRRISGVGGQGGLNGVGKPGGQSGKDSFGISYDGDHTWSWNGGWVSKVRLIYPFWSSLLFKVLF